MRDTKMRNPMVQPITLLRRTARFLFAASLAVLLYSPSPGWAQSAPDLNSAEEFAVLAGTAVTCTTSVITGDVGSLGAFTNTGCTIAGEMPPATNADADEAYADFLSAYDAIWQSSSSSCVQVLGNLAGLNLPPGVYCTDAVAKAGTLTLTGPSSGVWIFLVDGALTGTDFSVVMANGGQPCNVFWAPSAATTMTTSAFKGNILAGGAIDGSITLTGGSLAGSALAAVAVTMTNASVVDCDVLSDSPSCKGKKKKHDDDDDDGDDDDDDDHDDDDDDDDNGNRFKKKFGKR